MIGGNEQFAFFRAVTALNEAREQVTTYDDENPIYEDIWCRKVQRGSEDRVEIRLTGYAQPLVEEYLLIVPIDVALEKRDLAKQLATGISYVVLGAENTSEMDRTYQCPIVRVEGVTKVPT